jgi:hypothetical protein
VARASPAIPHEATDSSSRFSRCQEESGKKARRRLDSTQYRRSGRLRSMPGRTKEAAPGWRQLLERAYSDIQVAIQREQAAPVEVPAAVRAQVDAVMRCGCDGLSGVTRPRNPEIGLYISAPCADLHEVSATRARFCLCRFGTRTI